MIIENTKELSKYCADWVSEPFITVDTEFLRDKTYWPVLCLIQVGWSNGAVAIDPLADGMDLSPFFEILQNPNVIKVFHAARQDLEIFFKLSGKIPSPLVDTQVAAMVCGYGEQASYETLVNSIAKQQLDKSLRFTDWSIRPLSEGHIKYALGDVIHLRVVYAELHKQAERTGRLEWMMEEMQNLTDPSSYAVNPRDMWKRIRARSHKPRFLNFLRELCAWREIMAQKRDVPRSRIIKDDGILEIASYPPNELNDFSRYRQVYGLNEKEKNEIISILHNAAKMPTDEWPHIEHPKPLTQSQSALLELLKVLLRIKSDQNGVAAKIIATSEDLELFARGQDDECIILRGWRRKIYGEDAIALRDGKLALGLDKKGLRLIGI